MTGNKEENKIEEKNIKKIVCLIFITGVVFFAGCQTPSESTKDFGSIYPHALRGDVKTALEILDSLPNAELTKKQLEIKEKYYKRFKEQNEEVARKTEDPFVRYIIETFHNYWKKVFLRKSSLKKAEEVARNDLVEYLFANNLVEPNETKKNVRNNLDKHIKKILRSKGHYSIMSRTPPYRELMIWQEQTEQEYVIQLPEGEQRVKVVFMGDFLSHGWSEYATLGRSQAGGWTTKDAIYCLKSYDVSSENFRVSLLVHEGQHFADYKSFPKLKATDLEYRAKLAELSKAKETIYSLLKHFTDNAKYDKKHPHPFANYCIIRDLSKRLFDQDFVSDMKKWEAISHEKINEASAELLKRNTRQLKSAGAESVTDFLN